MLGLMLSLPGFASVGGDAFRSIGKDAHKSAGSKPNVPNGSDCSKLTLYTPAEDEPVPVAQGKWTIVGLLGKYKGDEGAAIGHAGASKKAKVSACGCAACGALARSSTVSSGPGY